MVPVSIVGIVTMIVIVRVPVIVRVRMTMIVTVRMRMPMRMLVVDRLHAGSDGHVGLRLRVQSLTEEEHECGSQQREQGDQPDLV